MVHSTVGALLMVFLICAALAALVCVLTETVSRFLGLRGEYLVRGIRSLVDGHGGYVFRLTLKDMTRRTAGRPPSPDSPVVLRASGAAAAQGDSIDSHPSTTPMVTKIMQTSFIANSARNGEMPENTGDASLPNRYRRQLPSYLSGRTFSRAVIEIIAYGPGPRDLRIALKFSEPGPLTDYLDSIGESLSNPEDAAPVIAEWYDDHMDRVSGWYKRHIRWISLAIATGLVLILNVNAVQMGRSVFDQVGSGSGLPISVQCDGGNIEQCAQQVLDVDVAAASSQPLLGWGHSLVCINQGCSWTDSAGLTDPTSSGFWDVWAFITFLAGWAAMIITLTVGARLWFDLFSRWGTFGSSGPKPPSHRGVTEVT